MRSEYHATNFNFEKALFSLLSAIDAKIGNRNIQLRELLAARIVYILT